MITKINTMEQLSTFDSIRESFRLNSESCSVTSRVSFIGRDGEPVRIKRLTQHSVNRFIERYESFFKETLSYPMACKLMNILISHSFVLTKKNLSEYEADKLHKAKIGESKDVYMLTNTSSPYIFLVKELCVVTILWREAYCYKYFSKTNKAV